MLSTELVDLATRHQVYLERFKAGELKRSDPLFVALAAAILTTLRDLDNRDLNGLTIAEQGVLIETIRTQQVELYGKELERLTNMLRDLGDFAREYELLSLNEVTVDGIVAQDDDDREALWAFVQDKPMSATGKLLAAWLGAWMAFEVTRGTDLVRKGIAQGWTANDLSVAFRGSPGGGYMDGLFASSRRNTATTINTAVQHVSATARARTMEVVRLQPADAPALLKTDSEGNVTSIPRVAKASADGAGITVGTNIALLGYRWLSILDGKTTQICRSLDGQVFKFNQGPLPPAHPNCRSSIAAEMLGRWMRRGPDGRFVSRDPRTSEGADGTATTPGSVTYYDWLKTQPEAFQNDALGVTRAKVFRDGGLSAATFAKLNLGRNFRPLTLDEMRKLMPNAFKRAGL